MTNQISETLMSQTPNQLEVSLKKLQKASQEIIKTKGYNTESEKINILIELIKEQGQHENSHPTNR